MISDRKLKKWRAEALVNNEAPEVTFNNVRDMAERILVLTQEVADKRLLLRMAYIAREDQKQIVASMKEKE